METKILSEIKQIKKIFSQLVGTSDLPARQKFSKDAIAKTAKEYLLFEMKRGEWVIESDISIIIRNIDNTVRFVPLIPVLLCHFKTSD